MDITDLPERWVIISAGDGYETHIVVGREAMERKFLEMFLGPPGDPFRLNAENVAYGESLLEHLQDRDNWQCNYALGPVEYRTDLEDGHVCVYLLIPDSARSAGEKP